MAKETLILLGIAIGVALCVNTLSPKGIPLIGDWDISKGVVSARSKDGMVAHELEINDVRMAGEIFRAGGAVFVDARTREAFAEGHIRGAFSMPVNRFEERVEEFSVLYPISTHIVTYCSGRECTDNHQLAQDLLSVGYMNTNE